MKFLEFCWRADCILIRVNHILVRFRLIKLLFAFYTSNEFTIILSLFVVQLWVSYEERLVGMPHYIHN